MMENKKEVRYEKEFGDICNANGIMIDRKGHDKIQALDVDEYYKPLIVQLQEFVKSDKADWTLQVGSISLYASRKVEDKEQSTPKTNVEEFLDITYDKKGNETGRKVSVPKTSRFILDHYIFKTIFGKKTETVYTYEDGIYVATGRALLQTTIERLLEDYSNNHSVREIVEKIKRSTEIKLEVFDDVTEELSCVENGILNVKTGDLVPHSPDYYFKVKFEI